MIKPNVIVTYPPKRTPRAPGVYEVHGGWKHTKNSQAVFADRLGAETDYRFACEEERAQWTD